MARVYDNPEWCEILEKHDIDPEPKPVISASLKSSSYRNQAPPKPSYFVERPEVSIELKKLLLSATTEKTGTLVISAIYGLGGIGKSTVGANTTTTVDRPFHIRSTFIPPITNITLELHGYGRKLHIPGDRQYAPWQISVYDDIDGSATSGSGSSIVNTNLWKEFSNWHNTINNHVNNSTTTDGPSYTNYKQTWQINHLDLNGSIIKTFTMHGCWPKTVSAIDHNMTNRNFLNTFSVVMLYDEIEIGGVTDTTPTTA